MISAIILAAGKGTRMKSNFPKVLHPVAGKPMIARVVDAARAAGCDRVIAVLGHGGDTVLPHLPPGVEHTWQTEQLGTGHAVLAARRIAPDRGEIVILSGDVPLLRPETITRLVQQHRASGATLTLVSCDADEPGDLGRVLRDDQGRVIRVVEARDATPDELQVRESNSGVYCAEGTWLWPVLEALPLGPTGEFYLTDAVEVAARQGRRIEVVRIHDREETVGINDRVQLARAEAAVWRRNSERLMRAGVTIRFPESCFIHDDVEIAVDTVIEPFTHLWGKTKIGAGCVIGPNSVVSDSTIGDECRIIASWVESSVLEANVDVGPFSHLRAGSYLEAAVHVGNFGEIKNSRLGAGSKMGHFSYVGDATLGRDVNVGAGTVTCNLEPDDARKHRTEIGDGAFIGSDTMLVAPVRIGAGATTGAGAVVTKDVPPGTLAVGVPARVRESEPAPQKNS